MSTPVGKVKEKKGKGKGLPKLKTILANPKKERCPALDEHDLQNLGALLKDALKKSGLKPQAFATATHIHIGLESSLRAINNLKCSCVLLSHSIQPIFLIRLIARNAEVKNETVPVYVQTQLEDFTKEIFGIRALALVLPTVDEMRVAKLVGEELIKWVVARTKATIPKSERILPKVAKKKKPIELGSDNFIKAEIPATKIQKLSPQAGENVPKKLEGDFIALSDAMVVDKVDSEEDDQHLTAVLNKIVEKVEKHAASHDKIICNEQRAKKSSDAEAKMEQRVVTPPNSHKFADNNSSDSDDFLPEIYQPLTVHKIQPNPNKKPKKKRPKKNKQNKK